MPTPINKMPEGMTALTDPTQIPQYDIKGQIGVTGTPGSYLYGTPKITPEKLVSVEKINLPENPNETTMKADILTSGAESNLSEVMKSLTPPATAEETQYSDFQKQLTSLIKDESQLPAEQLTSEQTAKIPEMKQQFSELNTQLLTKIAEGKTLDTSYERENQIVEGKPVSLARMQGQQAQNYKMYLAQKNSLASEAGLIQAQAQGLQGQITAAQDTVNRAIDLKFKAKEYDIKILQSQLDAIKPILDKQEQKRAEAVQIMLNKQKQDLEDTKTKEKDISDIMVKAASNKADQITLNKIKSATSVQDAILAAGNFLADTKLSISEQLAAAEAGFSIKDGVIQQNVSPTDLGSVSYRNNNPLNIKFGNFTSKYGATSGTPATDGGNFAKFPDVETGLKAAKDLLKSSSYSNLSLEQAMRKWSGGGYGADIYPELGGKTTGKMSDSELTELIDAMKTREGWTPPKQTGITNVEDAYWQTLSVIPTQLKNSDAEKELIRTRVESLWKQGIQDPYKVADIFMGYKITKPDTFSDTIRDQFGKTNLDTTQIANIAKLINAGKKSEAVTIVENSLMKTAKDTNPDSYIGEATVRTAINRANTLQSTIDKLGTNSPVGVVSGSMETWLGRLRGKDAQNIATQVKNMTAEMRNQLSGTAVTDSEKEFLSDLIPEIYDTPANFMTKLANLKTQPLLQLNSLRSTMNIPELDESTLIDKNKRVDLYNGNIQSNIEQHNGINLPSSTSTFNGIKLPN